MEIKIRTMGKAMGRTIGKNSITNGTVAETPTETYTYYYSTITLGCGQNSAWKDQLKSYNGVAIKYDASGNPLNYLGKTMAWRGRKLMSIDNVAMDYDYNGLAYKHEIR